MSIIDMIKNFFKVHNDLRDFLKDVAIGLAVVAVVFLALYLYAGTWPPILSITSGSMSPHMEKGDLVLIQGLERGDVHTYEGQESVNYLMFGERGRRDRIQALRLHERDAGHPPSHTVS